MAEANAAHLNRQAANAPVSKCCACVPYIKPEQSRRQILVEHFLVGAVCDFFGELPKPVENSVAHGCVGYCAEAVFAQKYWSDFQPNELTVAIEPYDDDQALAFERRGDITGDQASQTVKAE